MDQLAELLRRPSPLGSETIERSATIHGAALLNLGYTVAQVVHDYGDICQAITELAGEVDALITTDEFHTLNRCLDNAIDWLRFHDRPAALAGQGVLVRLPSLIEGPTKEGTRFSRS